NPRRLRSFAFTKSKPGHHGLTNMNSPVIQNGRFKNRVDGYLQYLSYTPAQKIVPEMTKMQRLIGIGRRVLHNDPVLIGMLMTNLPVRVECRKKIDPITILDYKIKIPFNYVIGNDKLGIVVQ